MPYPIQHTNWYLLYTCTNFEKKLSNLLQELKIETFLPLQKEIRIWSDRKKMLEVPLFPNYLFVKTQESKLPSIYGMPGVVRFVTFGSKPLVVREEEINLINNLIVSEQVIYKNNFFKGDRVKVVKGPLCGWEGVLFEEKGKSRFGIKLDSIEQSISIDICSSCLDKVN